MSKHRRPSHPLERELIIAILVTVCVIFTGLCVAIVFGNVK